MTHSSASGIHSSLSFSFPSRSVPSIIAFWWVSHGGISGSFEQESLSLSERLSWLRQDLSNDDDDDAQDSSALDGGDLKL